MNRTSTDFPEVTEEKLVKDDFREKIKLLLLIPILICSIVLILYATLNSIGAGDTWWYLASGKYIVENGTVPKMDPFSHTFQGKPWINVYWLTHVVFYLIYSAFGREGLAIYKIIVVTLIFSLVVARVYLKTGDYYLSLFCMAIIAYFGRVYLDIRAQLLTFLFITLCMLLVDLYRKGHKKVIYAIPLLIIPWANLHGGFLYVFFILGALWFSELVNIFKYTLFSGTYKITDYVIKELPLKMRLAGLDNLKDEEFSREKLRKRLTKLNYNNEEVELILKNSYSTSWLRRKNTNKLEIEAVDNIKSSKKGLILFSFLAGASIIAGLINPYLIGVYIYPLNILKAPSFREILEWLPSWRVGVKGFMTWAYWPYCIFFISSSLTELWLLIYRKKPFSLPDFIINWITFFMALSSRRFIPLFVFISIPICFETVYSIYRVKTQDLVSRNILFQIPAFLFKGGIIFYVFYMFLSFQTFAAIRSSGGLFNYMTVDKSFPESACDFIHNNDLKGNLFNYYNWGGYIAWKLYPQMLVFIDGRGIGIYSEDLYNEYRMLGGPVDCEFVQSLMEKHNIEVVLLNKYVQKNIADNIYKTNKWHYIYQDENSVIFLKKNHKYEDFMEKLKAGNFYIPPGDVYIPPFMGK